MGYTWLSGLRCRCLPSSRSEKRGRGAGADGDGHKLGASRASGGVGLRVIGQHALNSTPAANPPVVHTAPPSPRCAPARAPSRTCRWRCSASSQSSRI
jgi:hypothetical protein